MDAREIQLKAVQATGRQLDQAVAGLSDENWTKKVNDQAMSPVEIFAHLAECYDMFNAVSRGEKKEWGSYVLEDRSPEAVRAACREQRAEAEKHAAAAETDEDLLRINDYIVLHDAYHVGQLVTLRLTLDPEWDSYSIYS